MGPKILVNIVSVIAEVFLIWTNLAKTKVAWTSVTMTVGRHLLKIVPGTYIKSLDIISSVTADIFLIWTNVAWTNVTVTLGIC